MSATSPYPNDQPATEATASAAAVSISTRRLRTNEAARCIYFAYGIEAVKDTGTEITRHAIGIEGYLKLRGLATTETDI